VAKILVVDDNAANRNLVVTLLGYRGHSLLEASDGIEALALAAATAPDLIISDILMPRMDGYEFVRRLRSAPLISNTPVIFYTAHYRERDARELARECGVEYVLTKPCEPEEILRVVNRCIGRVPATPAVVTEEFDRDHLRLLTDKLSTVNLRLQALIDVALQLASEKQHDVLLGRFCDSARSLIACKYALVGITPENGHEGGSLHVAGLDLELNPIMRDGKAINAAISSILESGQPIRLTNSGGDPKQLALPSDCPSFDSLLAAPIKSLSDTYGWLCLFHRLGAPEFSAEDEHLAGILGALAGRIYENGRMYSMVRRHAARLEQEIAERTKAELALRRSEAQYRLYFENSPLPGWLYDTQSLRFLAVNAAAIRDYGYTQDEFLSMTLRDIRPAEDIPKLLEGVANIKLGMNHSGPWRHKRKDGTIKDVEIFSYPIPEPRPTEFVLVHDITERLRNEIAIRESSERLNLALNASRTGIWTWDAAIDRLMVDVHAREILGLEFEPCWRLADLLEIIHPDDRGLTRNSFHAGGEVAVEFRVVWPKGAIRYVTTRGQAFRDESGNLVRVTGVIHDNTEQRSLEQQFRQAQKMEAVGQLAAGIAHDFNNVLTVIIGFGSLLLTQASDGDKVALSQILSAGERGAALTTQLLALSRKQALQPRVVNLAASIEDMDRLVRRLIGENIEVATIIDRDLGNVEVDPNQIEQVILNLVVNARDAMPSGGKLTIELRNVEVDEIYARKHDVPRGNFVLLAVSDNGVGMTPDVQQRAFEPFFTTKEPGRGTGLGLATVYGIVKQSGGHLWLYSEAGIGTTFKIFLPRVDQQAEAAPRPSPARVSGGNETILVVEDDSEVRALVEEILGSVGYEVLVAADGEQALKIVERYQGEIQLLVTDVVLQKIGGRQSADRLIEIRPGMKVLFMSGYTADAILNQGILGHDVNFLPKPFTVDGLCSAVRSVLDSQSAIRRILVVDDEESIREMLKQSLEQAGFEIMTAADGRHARAQALGRPIDLIITDLAMPEEEGIELIRKFREQHPGLKIIAMSGAFGEGILNMARALGADATISKPLTPATILKSINEVARRLP